MLLPSPDDIIDDANATLRRRLNGHSLYDLVYFEGKLRPVEEIMMACCAAVTYGSVGRSIARFGECGDGSGHVVPELAKFGGLC